MSFQSLLIANRGEIACRIIRTARAKGIRTIAVYSEADAKALHVRMADTAVCIGPASAAESYLSFEALLEAAKATRAEAIHPGYGFLSENAEFVEAVTGAGLVFVGPSAEAIRAMGLKDAAKARMEAAGVPVVPGYHGADQGTQVLKQAAKDIGYPVLIKAVAGGGGKGMRQVDHADDFAQALASAQREALAAFGNADVLVEKFVACPRHIEVQVFGDGKRAVHLYERDCSLQRRHQKVIEEAPAPGMTDQMREAMGSAAVKAAEAIGYSGAGTVEFIVDASDGLRPDRFYFMEMNTRLQVEHPVTEEVTGVDLVDWQLQVAGGAPLPLRQEEIPLFGHSFEARLYAEDPANQFLPVTGTLEHLRFASDARIETGVEAGAEISPHYDPMIAKIIVSGRDRAEALGALRRALAHTQIAGTVTNLPFLQALADHVGFAAGDVDTGLIARDLAALTEAPDVPDAVLAIAASAICGLQADNDPLQGFTLWQPLKRSVELGGESVAVEVTGPGTARVKVRSDWHGVEAGPGGWRIAGQWHAVEVRLTEHAVHVFDERTWHFDRPDPLAVDQAQGSGDVIRAPMPGLLREMTVSVGDMVEAGQRLAVLEAMKMEHALTAPRAGQIAEVLAKAGDQVVAQAALIRLEPEA